MGAEVARQAARTHDVTSVDPPLVPELRDRDGAATAALRDLVVRSGASMVVNACGLTRGTSTDLADANVEFPRWVCGLLAGTGVRLVHIGSASEYGDPGTDAPVAEDVPARPVGDYATTKARGTDVVLEARAAGLDAVVARVFNLVGHPVPAVVAGAPVAGGPAGPPARRWRGGGVVAPDRPRLRDRGRRRRHPGRAVRPAATGPASSTCAPAWGWPSAGSWSRWPARWA